MSRFNLEIVNIVTKQILVYFSCRHTLIKLPIRHNHSIFISQVDTYCSNDRLIIDKFSLFGHGFDRLVNISPYL